MRRLQRASFLVSTAARNPLENCRLLHSRSCMHASTSAMRLRTWALCGTGTLVSVHLQRSNGVAPASSLVWVQALATCGNALWSLTGSWEATNKTLNAIFKRTTASTSSKHTEMAQRVSSFHKCRSQASDALQFEPWPWHASAGTALFPGYPCQAADPLPELLLSFLTCDYHDTFPGSYSVRLAD